MRTDRHHKSERYQTRREETEDEREAETAESRPDRMKGRGERKVMMVPIYKISQREPKGRGRTVIKSNKARETDPDGMR